MKPKIDVTWQREMTGATRRDAARRVRPRSIRATTRISLTRSVCSRFSL